MSLIVGKGVGKSFGADYVIRGARFRVAAGERIGLVGANGTGKTTLLRMLAGLDAPTVGAIERRTGLRVGYLPQDAPVPAGKTLWQSMLDVFAGPRAMEAELAELAGRLHEDGDGALLRRYGELQARLEAAGGYDYETPIRAVLTGLGFSPAQYDQPLAQLSGGQRTRGLLGKLLLEEPEVLLLDEPTNHLDLEAVEWLERFLVGFRQALIVVSHDRYFLDRVTERTWEIAFNCLETYRGSYTEYVRKREEHFRERLRRWEAQQEFVERTEEFIRRNLAGQRSKEAQGRRTRLERFLATEAMPKPQAAQRVVVRIAPRQRSGELVLRVRELAVGYRADAPLVEVGDLEVRRGQRIALIGPNGIGKTTLLRTLLGELPPLRGRVERGACVDLGYLPQTHDRLRGDDTALNAVLAVDPMLTVERARTLLGSLLLSGDDVFKRIDQLSGGQRSRVVFAQLAVLAPNVLVLDEPTNHLDLPSREVIQELLRDFDGTVIFTSHDRYLVAALATHIWALEDGRLHSILGSWDQYARWRTEYRQGVAAASPPAVRQRKDRRESNLEARRRDKERQRIQRKLEGWEQSIAALEGRLRELMDASGLAGEAGDLDQVHRIGREYQQADAELKQLWESYFQLSEQLES